MNIKEDSLRRALSAACVSELPKLLKDDNGEYWLEAIALVRKMDCTQSYALVSRKHEGRIKYVADFGTMSPIVGLVAIHPYLYLDKARYMPYETLEQKKIALIEFIGGDDEARDVVNKMSDKEIESHIFQIAIDMQYSTRKTNAAHDRILAAVNSISFKEAEDSENKEEIAATNEDNIIKDDIKRMPSKRTSRTKKNV